MTLKFCGSVKKELKVENFRGLIPTFVEVTRKKLVGEFFASPIPKRVKVKRVQEARGNQFPFQNVQNN